MVAPDSAGLLSLVKGELRPDSFLLRDGAAATKIDDACRALEDAGVRPAWPRDLMTIDGRWRLVYSSTLALQNSQLPPISLPNFFSDALEQAPLGQPPAVARRMRP